MGVKMSSSKNHSGGSSHEVSEFAEDRRRTFRISEEQLTQLTEAVCDRLWNKLYLQLGKATFRLFLYILGPICVAAYFWIKAGGI